MTHQPTKAVCILGESLVLFRDALGSFGLIGDRCPHRRASLLFGMPDGEGLRCAYHGWRFDRAGQSRLFAPPTLGECRHRASRVSA
jgi:5,5'-dehydrodivanillate O-demethylase